MDERHDCRNTDAACVPSTVWGTASNVTAKFRSAPCLPLNTGKPSIEIIRLYGLRFKIEHTFKQAVRLIGSFSYNFWMSDMKPLRRRSGNHSIARRPGTATPSGASCTPTTSSSRRLSSVRDCLRPRRRLPAARLGRFRLPAAHHPARHPALRAGRGQCPAPEYAGISPEFRHSQHLREIRHRTTEHR